MVDKHAVADWVLSFQGQFYGFHGSRCSQFPSDDNGVSVHNCSHLASTYSALAILKVIGYDFSEIDSETMTSMKNLQQPDGSPFLTNLSLCGFMPIHIGAGTDLRFVYCAASICSLLKNWSGMEKEKARNYILNCKGCLSTVVSVILWWFWFNPWIRVSCGTGGATYCAVASLRLMSFIEDDLLSKNRTSSILDVPLLLDWSLQRQFIDGGFQGRPNKPSDTCYAFCMVVSANSQEACQIFTTPFMDLQHSVFWKNLGRTHVLLN